MSALREGLLRASLTGFPVAATVEDYATAAAEIDAALERLPGFVSLYGLGSVSVPGISDIDRIAVVEPGARVSPVWPHLSPQARSLAMHSPFLTDTHTFAAHRWFAFLSPLRRLRGEELEVRPVPSARADRLMAVESLLLNYVRLAKSAHLRRAKVRAALCEINSIRHGAALAGLPPGPSAEAVRRLRERWFSLARPEQEDAFRRALAASLDDTLATLATFEGPGEAASLRLAAPWSSVVVGVRGRSPAAWRRLAARLGRRPGEVAWRWRDVRLAVPPGALRVLQAAAHPAAGSFEAERQQVVARYSAFLATQPSDYSAIGMARLIHG